MNKRYNYDEKSDSLFICVREGEEESFEEIVPGINVELDKNDEIIGVEILHASRFAKKERKTTSALSQGTDGNNGTRNGRKPRQSRHRDDGAGWEIAC